MKIENIFIQLFLLQNKVDFQEGQKRKYFVDIFHQMTEEQIYLLNKKGRASLPERKLHQPFFASIKTQNLIMKSLRLSSG